MNRIDELKRDIDTLLEANQHDWRTIASSSSPKDRVDLKRQIFARNEELKPMVEEYLTLKNP